jgi:hypothetical protein
LYATAGNIAGWNISPDSLVHKNTKEGDAYKGYGFAISLSPYIRNSGTNVLAIGDIHNDNDWSTANFRVTSDGTLHASGAVIKGDSVFTGNLNLDGGATITGKISADHIEADALTVESISADKITSGSTSANIGMSGSVTISGNLIVSGTGKIGGMTLSGSSISASGSSSTSLTLTSTFYANMTYSSNQVTVSSYGSGWYNRVYYIPEDGTVSMSGSSNDEFYIMNTIPHSNGSYSASKWRRGSISATVSTGQYLIHNTSSSTTRIPSLSVSTSFGISSNGALTASNATITGNITATTGSVGGWAISGDKLIGSFYDGEDLG